MSFDWGLVKNKPLSSNLIFPPSWGGNSAVFIKIRKTLLHMVNSGNSTMEDNSTELQFHSSAVVYNCIPVSILTTDEEEAISITIASDTNSLEKITSGSIVDSKNTIDQFKNQHNYMETNRNFPLTSACVKVIKYATMQPYFWMLMFISMGFSAHGQDNSNDGSGIRFSKRMAIVMDKSLPFGSKLGMDSLPVTATWEIEDAGGTIINGVGNSLNDYVFSIPGSYTISIQENVTFEPGSCQHNACPDMIQLKVTNTRMTFHHNEITFSEPIRVEVETQGTVMNVPVTIERYNAFLPLEYTYTEVKSAGIQTDITAELMQGTVLTEGKQTLVYQLNGKAHKPAYLMFDFIDINGMVQSYAMQQPVLQ